MNPIRFQSRTDLINYVEQHPPRQAILRAINEGSVRVLGGFTSIPPGLESGWIIEVTSKHDRIWPVGVIVDDIKHRYIVRILDEVPWDMWAGKLGRNHPVYDGDKPQEFAIKRAMASIDPDSLIDQLEKEMME